MFSATPVLVAAASGKAVKPLHVRKSGDWKRAASKPAVQALLDSVELPIKQFSILTVVDHPDLAPGGRFIALPSKVESGPRNCRFLVNPALTALLDALYRAVNQQDVYAMLYAVDVKEESQEEAATDHLLVLRLDANFAPMYITLAQFERVRAGAGKMPGPELPGVR